MFALFFVKFIPKCFVLSDAVVNEILSLISCPVCSLPLSRNPIYFRTLISQPATSLNAPIGSDGFQWVPRVLRAQGHVLGTWREPCFCPGWVPLISYSRLMPRPEASVRWRRRRVWTRPPCSRSRGKSFCFRSSVRLHSRPSLLFLVSFHHRGLECRPLFFPESIEMTVGFSVFYSIDAVCYTGSSRDPDPAPQPCPRCLLTAL